ncbi:MAG: hypothetical protein JWP95_577, partial [Actinotalea sp.]|nr:hypothetical protein [Actinotalea sp.]
WQESVGKTVSLSLLLDRTAVDAYLAAPAAEKGDVLSSLVSQGAASYRA